MHWNIAGRRLPLLLLAKPHVHLLHSSTNYHYTREDQSAAIANTRVQHDDDAYCIGGAKGNCGDVVYFYSEP